MPPRLPPLVSGRLYVRGEVADLVQRQIDRAAIPSVSIGDRLGKPAGNDPGIKAGKRQPAVGGSFRSREKPRRDRRHSPTLGGGGEPWNGLKSAVAEGWTRNPCVAIALEITRSRVVQERPAFDRYRVEIRWDRPDVSAVLDDLHPFR